MSADLEDIKREVAIGNRVLAATGLAAGALASLGHVSMRVPSEPERFVVKGRGYEMDALSAMRPQDMVLCDLDGYRIQGPAGVTQCNEVQIHACIYKTHPEIQSVVHVHPRFTVIMSVVKGNLVPVCREGMALVRKPLPVYSHVALVTTVEEGMELAGILGDRKAALLHGHGAVTVGASIEEAVMNMVNLEEQAKMNWYAHCAAGPDYPSIPEELIAEDSQKPGFNELPYFKDAIEHAGPVKARGVWQYYTNMVSQDL